MLSRMKPDPLRTVDIPGRTPRRGKVRDVFDLGNQLLIVASDRLSAFDCVLPDPIPLKGHILTGMSKYWFDLFTGRFNHHLIEIVRKTPPRGFESAADKLSGRAMICKKASVIPIECVARGYVAGSGWKDYQNTQAICGIPLPPGLQLCSKLPKPIFTPATKAESGHDENISFDDACKAVGNNTMSRLRELTLAIYTEAAEYLETRGIILADTKFEFGFGPDGSLILIDEVLTPDSSRFWPADKYKPGRDQESFDKQFVRNYLQSLCDAGQWDKTDPAPSLPADVIAATTARYLEAYERVTGQKFEDWLKP